MSRYFLASAITALALGGCVDNNADSGLTLLRNIAPSSGCVLAADSTDFRSSGRIQSDSGRGYLFTPIARNDLEIADGEPTSQKTVFVEGAHVTVGFYDADLFTSDEQAQFREDALTRFAVPTSGAIDPGGGTATFGFEIVPAELIELIDAKLTDTQPSQLLDVTVELYGSRAGSSIESNTFRYPVEVCKGCVVENVGRCVDLPTDFAGGTGGACNALQDGVLACCTGPNNEDVCPAVPATTPET